MLAALAACSHDPAPPPLPHLASDARVLAFGDSLTFGTGATPEQAYPAVLAGLIGREVKASGIPGETSGDGRARLPGVLDEIRPQLLLLCEGGNDLLQHLDRDAMKANLAAMIREAQARGISVVLLGVPTPKLGNLQIDPVYGELAEQFHLPLERHAFAEVLGQRALKSDPFHPNADGYRQVAKTVAGLLKAAQAI